LFEFFWRKKCRSSADCEADLGAHVNDYAHVLGLEFIVMVAEDELALRTLLHSFLSSFFLFSFLFFLLLLLLLLLLLFLLLLLLLLLR
jgi:hypothetical protein